MSTQEKPKKERTFIYTVARIVSWLGGHTFFPVRYHGLENMELDAPYIAISNHQSAFDPLFLGYPCKKYEYRFVGKKELVKNKFLEKLLAHADIVVLSSMHENVLHFRIRLKSAAEWCNLHKIRARPDY